MAGGARGREEGSSGKQGKVTCTHSTPSLSERSGNPNSFYITENCAIQSRRLGRNVDIRIHSKF